MATVTMPHTVRRPFASLDATRLRSLQKAKANFMNRQNGAAAISRKRPVPSDSDSENVDPTSLTQSTKRKRSLEDEEDLSNDSSKTPKTNRIALASSESRVTRDGSTPLSNSTSRPSSAPTAHIGKPAGRSPPFKACKVFGRHSTNASTRAELLSKRAVHRAPFSIATALAADKPKRRSPIKPASWCFDIYVDTVQDEMTNSMQHSACFLDISDDESKSKTDGRGKENIPPHELGITMPTAVPQTTSVATSRKNMMSDELRAPLGELKTSDYYGAGCHALSFTVVDDDDGSEKVDEKQTPSVPNLDFTSSASQKPELLSESTISSLLETTAPVVVSETAPEQTNTIAPSDAEIEIWESGSAAEEAANAPAASVETINIFASS